MRAWLGLIELVRSLGGGSCVRGHSCGHGRVRGHDYGHDMIMVVVVGVVDVVVGVVS